MQITTQFVEGVLELRMEGRLDNEAADDLTAAVDETLRKGHHAALLDLLAVDYVSSAGLGAMVRAHKKFQAIHGAFGVARLSPQAAEILQLTGLARLLVCDAEKVRQKYAAGEGTVLPSFRIAAADGLQLAIYDLNRAARLRCQTWGEAALAPGRSPKQQSWPVRFSGDSFGLGIAAFGQDHADCADRFGEFVAVAGAVAVQPTPEGGKPDYQLASGSFVPEPHLLYGLSLTGEFSQMIRFEPQEPEGRMGFSTVVEQCLTSSASGLAGMVLVGEAAGLIGAKLRRSPASASCGNGATFTHPEIRKWFSFTAEHIFPHSLVVVAGVASRGVPAGEAAALAALVRPLSPESDTHGHFHAAVFSYRPLKKRRLNLHETVLNLFDSEDLQAVLHLLHDDRAIAGGGESQLVSGACWVGPLVQVAAEGRAP